MVPVDHTALAKSKRSADFSFVGAVRDLATGTGHRSRFTSEKERP
ncbi:hypothetical protein H4W33_000499 [Kibdelosporangium phytohabitans]|nr:hypothetical protein [Kibdelosporangium phytohabitans]